MIERSSHAVLDVFNRQPKAEKIRALLDPWLRSRRGLRLLEVGTGSGAIAHFFSVLKPQVATVSAIDVVDQRTGPRGYDFRLYDGSRFPFEGGSFDVVISNHVIEHVGDRESQLLHLCEVRRVLAAKGVGYLATPSRWQPIEPHFKLAGLSWIPRRWRTPYLRFAGRAQVYDCDPLSHREIEGLMRMANLPFCNQNAKAFSVATKFEGKGSLLSQLFDRLPRSVLQRFYRFSPTMVYLFGALGERDINDRC